jgi:uncharacterized protein
LPLLGKDMMFFDLLEKQAGVAVAASDVFRTMCNNPRQAQEQAAKAEEIERQSSEVSQQLLDRADSTFVTPLDKEDLYALTSALQAVTSRIEAAVARIGIFHFDAFRPDLLGLADLMVQTVHSTSETINGLRHMHGRDTIHPNLLQIRDGKRAADRSVRASLCDLFQGGSSDLLTIIKWQDLYTRIESVFETCEQTANVIEAVVIKYA